MLTWLVALTVIEILLLALVLVVYLGRVWRGLGSVADSFAKVAFGVRAIERQLSGVVPDLRELNDGLEAVSRRLPSETGRG